MVKTNRLKEEIMKKLALALLTLASAVVFIGCGTSAPAAIEFESDADLYSFQAVTASTLLSETFASALALPLADETEEQPVVEEEIDVLDKYLAMMETYLGETGALSVEPLVSDRPEYQVMIVFTTKTLAGESIVYTLYWNETPFVEEDPIVTEDPEADPEQPTTETQNQAFGGRPEGFRFQDPEDENVTALLEGLLVIGETEVALEGKTIVNGDVTVTLLRAYIDEANHVAVRYMSGEDGDKQFFYTVVENGRLVNRTAVKVMNQDGKVFTQLMFLEGEARGRYNFSIETVENVTTIHINYLLSEGTGRPEQGNILITATYDEATGLTSYEYVVRPDNMGPRGPRGMMPGGEFTYHHEHDRGEGMKRFPPEGNAF
jgi:hypothetical protein